MSEFTLGQRVRYTRPISRRSVPLRTIERIDPYKRELHINREWVPNPYAKEEEGVIIGRRTLSNGHSAWEYEGDGGGYYLWEGAEYFTAYMVVKDLRSAPVHVLPEHITPMETP